mmetsp:Transcript_28655/g.36933  ORF Transcript_28655/g.36933 Transcript_28655/m.36933 type:complete len:81 (-) Transcript_28655:273-515(-)
MQLRPAGTRAAMMTIAVSDKLASKEYLLAHIQITLDQTTTFVGKIIVMQELHAQHLVARVTTPSAQMACVVFQMSLATQT